MTLRETFNRWCHVHGYFPEDPVYVRDTVTLGAQCARLVRLHSPQDEKAGNEQHYVLEARFGATNIVYPLGQERRDIIEMEKALTAGTANGR